MKYDLKGEREKRNLSKTYLSKVIEGVSYIHYCQMEEEGVIDNNTLYQLHQKINYPIPADFNKYFIETIKLNCLLWGITGNEVQEELSKAGLKVNYAKRMWKARKMYSLYDYKEIIDKIFPVLYVPCEMLEDGSLKVKGEKLIYSTKEIKEDS